MFTSFYKMTLRLVLLFGCMPWFVSGPTVAGETPSFLLGGIQVNEPDTSHWVETLDRVGMNTVEVTVYARQGRWDSSDLTYAEQEPAVLAEIRAAHRQGLQVVLILRVAIDHAYPENRFIWHGMIQPIGREARAEWFRRYGEFARHWARIAQHEGIAVLGIGSELNALTATRPIGRWSAAKNYHAFVLYHKRMRRRVRRFSGRIDTQLLWVRGRDNYDDLREFLDDRVDRNRAWARRSYLRGEPDRFRNILQRREDLDHHWNVLIDSLREIYDGHLTYAANFDSYRDVGFWHRLDSIGINAYFPLRKGIDRIDPRDQSTEFDRAWSAIFSDVARFQRTLQLESKPILFTELGYTFRRHSTVEPWAHDGFTVVGWGLRPRRLVVWSEQPIDYGERNRALASLAEVRRRDSIPLMGILYWKLSTRRDHEAIEPFVMHVGEDSTDPLQDTLLGFLSGFGDSGGAIERGRRGISTIGDAEGQVSGPTARESGNFRSGRNR